METPKSLKKLHKISAFVAYSGMEKSTAPKMAMATSTPLSASEEKKKKKSRKRKRQAMIDHSDFGHGASIGNGIEDDSDLVILNGDDDEVEEIPVLVPIEAAAKKSKAKKLNAGEFLCKSTPSLNSSTEEKRVRFQSDNGKISDKGIASGKKAGISTGLANGGSSSIDQASGVSNLLSTLTYANSAVDARKAFAWLIDPIDMVDFFQNYWEKEPLYIKREGNGQYFDGLFSSDMMDSILREHGIQYGVNLDITKYENGERKTLNPTGRAYASTVWDFYKDGCSVRMLNPQTYSEAVWKLNSTLQEFFGTFVGANVYLTPANTQGFAPHYDDIEAFILQLEGVKRWRVYYPMNEEETLPRFSSRNYKPEEMGEPMMEIELHPGDLMYFPRGFIHEAVASKDQHSLHITISTTQRNSYGDLIQMMVEQAVQVAMAENIQYRRALPLNYMDIAGTVHMDRKKKGRKDFVAKINELMAGLINHASIDNAVDQMVKEKFMQDCLPPCLTEDEKRRCIHGNRKDVPVIFKENTKVRLIRKQCLRLVLENESDISIYYNTENSRIYREKPLQKFNVEPDLAPGIDYLVETYPKYIPLKDLPLDTQLDKVRICQLLYEKALLIIE